MVFARTLESLHRKEISDQTSGNLEKQKKAVVAMTTSVVVAVWVAFDVFGTGSLASSGLDKNVVDVVVAAVASAGQHRFCRLADRKVKLPRV